MKRKIYILLFFVSFTVFSQRETDHWYFGNGIGLNFSTFLPEKLTNSNMLAPFGSATISDKNGKLIFYTNGVSIWTENHFTINPGGMTPFTAGGDIDSAQNSIIVPLPESENIYYIFTISGNNNTKGLYYNVVDISSGRAVFLEDKKRLLSNTTGKISAVHHKNGKSIWIVTIASDEESDDVKYDQFYAYNLSKDGLGKSPIKSEAVATFIEPQKGGALKLSPDGKLIAAANYTRGIELYNFDSFTGIISNNKHITVMGPPADFTTPGIDPLYTYGIEFSPDSNFLYTTTIYDDPTKGGKKSEFLIQYRLEDLSRFILESNIIVSTENFSNSLQLASNGKIYKTNTLGANFKNPSNHLSVINNPSKLGQLTKFEKNALDFNNQDVFHGLPNFIQSYFRTRIISKDDCVFSDIDFNVDSYATITNVKWDFGDGNTSNKINPKHSYNRPGTYNVTAVITLNNREIIKNSEVLIYQLPALNRNQKLEQCDLDFDGLSNFDLNHISELISSNSINETFVFYKNLEDAEKDRNKIETPENFENSVPNQELFVRVINQNGCYNITSFNVEANFVDIGKIPDMYSCENSDNLIGNNEGYFDLNSKSIKVRLNLNISRTFLVRFFPSLNDAQTIKNEIGLNFNSPSTKIWLRIDTDKGCGGIAPINLIVNSEPKINLQEIYTICFNPNLKPPVIISADATNDSYEWKNNAGNIISTNKDFTLTTTGQFSLTVYKTENGLLCSSSKNFTVINPNKPTFAEIVVNTEDEKNNIVDVTVDGNSTYQFSLDNINFYGNSTSYTFTNVDPGLRTVYIKDINTCEESIQTNVSVIGFKKYFTPNGDNDNDFWNVKGLDAVLFKSINVSIFNRYGKLIGAITDFSSKGWDGTFNGKLMPPSNYWFTAKIIDKDDKIIQETGNFSLIRN